VDMESAAVRPSPAQTPATPRIATDFEGGRERRSSPVSRVLSSRFPGSGEHSSRGAVADAFDSEQPGSIGRAARVTPFGATLPYWLLHRVGFAVPPLLPGARCALTAPFHPSLPLAEQEVCFLWHCPAACADWPLTSTLPCGARTFLPPPRPAVAGVHPGCSSEERTTTSTSERRTHDGPRESDAGRSTEEGARCDPAKSHETRGGGNTSPRNCRCTVRHPTR
jgi:hypothetical protein